ncbi:MAG: XRE family transcriptional regulator [Bdellovibrionales bacterium]
MKKNKFPSENQLKKARKELSKGMASKPLSENASPVDRIKHLICQKIVIYMNEHKLSQRALAERIDESEALISKVVHYHFEEFTIDRLVKFLARLQPNSELKIEVA